MLNLSKTFYLLIFIICCQYSHAQTIVSGNISTNTTWNLAGSPYELSDDVIVDNGVVLTIEAGVRVEFPWVLYDLLIDGTLDAQGTMGNEITFQGTDASASNHGGMIHFRSGSAASILNHVIIDKMGDTNAAIDASLVISDNISIDNITITDSESVGIYIDATPTVGNVDVTTSATGLSVQSGAAVFDNDNFTSNGTGVLVAGGSPQISNSLIDGNSSDGIRVNGGTPTISGNTISNNSDGIEINGYFLPVITGNTFSGSTRDVFLPMEQIDKVDLSTNGLSRLHLSGFAVTTNTTINTTYVYEFTTDITVNNGATLTLQPGVLLEFPWVLYDLLIDGTLDAQGTLGNEITFQGTDASATNHGGMIHFRSGSAASILNHVIIDKMGDTNAAIDASLVISDNISIDNITITDSESVGIYIDATPTVGNVDVTTSAIGLSVQSGAAVFDNDNFTSNGTGVVVAGGSPQISNSLIDGNTSDGIRINGGTPTISGNTISNNSDGIEINGYFLPVITGNTFSGSTRDVFLPMEQIDKVDLTTNGLSRLYLSGFPVTTNTTINTAYVYEFTTDITVNNGATLTLQPGVLLEFPWVLYDLFIDGTLDAQGTLGNEITFQGTEASASNHGGMVHLRPGSSASILDYVVFDHMGDTNALIDASLVISDDISVDNLTITDSEGAGIYIDSDAVPTVGSISVTTSGTGLNIQSGSVVIDNVDLTSNGTGVVIASGSPQITNNMIGGASGDGIRVTGGTPTISGNTITGNTGSASSDGIEISGGTPTITGNAISNSYDGIDINGLFLPLITGNTLSSNTRNVLIPMEQVDKIDLTTNGLSKLHLSGFAVTSNTTINTTYVYEFTTDITVNNGATLTLQPGVLLEFPWVLYDLFIDGDVGCTGDPG